MTTQGDRTRKETIRTPEGKMKSMPARGVLTASSPPEEAIRRRAYEIYLARDGAPGDPVADWLQAERELREQGAVSSRRRDSYENR